MISQEVQINLRTFQKPQTLVSGGCFEFKQVAKNCATRRKLIHAELDESYTPSKIQGFFQNVKVNTLSVKFEEIFELACLAKTTKRIKNICRLKLHRNEELPGNNINDRENVTQRVGKIFGTPWIQQCQLPKMQKVYLYSDNL